MLITNRMKIMTLLDMVHISKIQESLWNENTLKPPLKVKEIVRDFQYHWKSYHQNKIGAYRRLVFLILMIYQRISYNIGWIISKFKPYKLESKIP